MSVKQQKLKQLSELGYVVVCNIFDKDVGEHNYKEYCEIVETRNFKKMCNVADEKLMPILKDKLGT